jgi:hypothetical protein
MKFLSQLLLLAVSVSPQRGHAFSALPSKLSLSSNVRNGDPSLHALLDPMLLSSVTDPSSPAIQQAFSVATFFPQPFWLFLVFLPKSDFTKKLMGGMEIVTLCCAIHFFIVGSSLGQPGATAPLEEFSGVFDPAGNPQAAFLGMMQYPNFVSEEVSLLLSSNKTTMLVKALPF